MPSHNLVRMNIDNLDIIGYSVAAEETVVAMPQLDVCFDIGKAPDQVIPINNVLITHGHIDHAAGIAYYLSHRNFCQMKPGTILINTCRGGVADEKAVCDALDSGHLYGHGIDVFEEEPPQFLDLLRHENVVSSPHVAGISEDGLINMASLSASKVIQYLNNDTIPENVLNPGVLERIKT